MKKVAVRPGCWPNPEQEALLVAALDKGQRSLEAWEFWRRIADWDHPLYGTQHVLPLLYRNLTDQGVCDPVMGILKGHYRLGWYKNQVLFDKVAVLLKALAAGGTPTMALKGTPLALQHYGDPGLRPMADFDLLVPPAGASAAITMMHDLGWRLKTGAAGLTPAMISVSNGASFRSDDGYEIDLHWYVLPECCYEGADEAFWTHAQPLTVAGAPTLAPQATELLLHICQHGYKWNPVPPYRWVADATVLLRRAGTSESGVDWQRFVSEAAGRRLALSLRNTLHYLTGLLDAPVPAWVLAALDAVPVSGWEHREYTALSRAASAGGVTAIHWARHTRRTGGAGLGRRAAGFPRYLQAGLGLDHLWELPAAGAAGLRRRVRMRRGQASPATTA